MLLPSLLLLAEPLAAAPFEDPCANMKAALDREAARPGPSNMTETVTVEETGSFCVSRRVINVYVDSKRRWVLRRISSQIGGPALPDTFWADSSSCPAILTWLERLERLPIAFGIGPVRKGERSQFKFRPLNPHGIHYEVRGRLVRQPSGAWATLSLSSNEGEVAEWSRGFLNAAAACWRSSPNGSTE